MIVFFKKIFLVLVMWLFLISWFSWWNEVYADDDIHTVPTEEEIEARDAKNQKNFDDSRVEPMQINVRDLYWTDPSVAPSVETAEELISNIIGFMTILIPSLAVLWVMAWWVMIMVSRDDEDILNRWKMSVIYSIVWLIISIVAYLIIQIIQSILASIWS